MFCLSQQQENNLTKLIKALISGDYRQGTCKLYNTRTRCHCVLGVAGEVGGLVRIGEWFWALEWGVEPLLGSETWDSAPNRGLASNSALPSVWFERKYGIASPTMFACKNDKGWSFAQLAAWFVSFLPNGPTKTELRHQINEALRVEDREAETVKHSMFGWSLQD